MKEHLEAAQFNPVWISRISRVLLTLAASVSLTFALPAAAVEFTTLYNFTNGVSGGAPLTSVVLSSNTLYGTGTDGAGIGSFGSVYAVNTDGTGFRNVYRFTGGKDGYYPVAGLVVSSNVLYGAAYYGGTNGNGTIFAINASSGTFTNLYSFSALVSFTNGDGANPRSGLILSGHTLYGTTYNGGMRNGTVFAINTDGTGFTNLHTFAHSGIEGNQLYTTLAISSNNILYGTTSAGGAGIGGGTIFSLATNGTAFTVLYNFGTNTTVGGYNPYAGLVLSSNTLYGTTQSGGSWSLGTVFSINTNAAGFTVLHNFDNTNGAQPWGTLALSGRALFGTTYSGGTGNYGAVYAVNTDGTGFTNLHNFYYATDGSGSEAGLIVSGHTLYGTAYSGGNASAGTVFSISSKLQLALNPTGAKLVLSWPTNDAGFDYSGYALQSAPGLGNTFTNIPGATSPYTNSLNSPAQFFRLISN